MMPGNLCVLLLEAEVFCYDSKELKLNEFFSSAHSESIKLIDKKMKDSLSERVDFQCFSLPPKTL